MSHVKERMFLAETTASTEVPKQSLTLHVSRKEGNHAIGNESL